MDFNKYDQKIRDLCTELTGMRADFDERMMEKSKELLAAAVSLQDSALEGFACYYVADSYYMFEYSDDKIQEFLSRGMICQKLSHEYELLTRSYNLLGIVATLHGSNTLAMDYYMTALEYSGKSDMRDHLVGIIKCNIAQIYAALGKYDMAMQFTKEAIAAIEQFPEDSFYKRNLITVYTMLGNQYLDSGRSVGEPLEWLEKARKLSGSTSERIERLEGVDILSLGIKVSHALGQAGERDRLIRELIQVIDTTPEIVDLIGDICLISEFLIKIGKMSECLRIINMIEGIGYDSDLLGISLRYEQLKIDFYDAVGDIQKAQQAAYRFFKLTDQKRKDDAAAMLFFINIRQDVERMKTEQHEIKEENRRLLQRADYDQLTQLPNRYKLNEYSDQMFEKAYHEKEKLAIEILDIDFFKQYNDCYGHQAGDDCLSKIAETIKGICRDYPGVYGARYGGDEFVMIYYGMTREQIHAIAEDLQRRVIALGLRNPVMQAQANITISQGIFNAVPLMGNKLWDFMYKADFALYEVKRNNKCGINITSRD